MEQVRHQVTIAGRATDALSGKPIRGALVRIATAPPAFTAWLQLRALASGDRWEKMFVRPDRTHTAADGHYHFVDLPDGQYTLTASLPAYGDRYGASQVGATVARDPQGAVDMAEANLSLRPTTVRGTVTGTGSTPVAAAVVRLEGTEETTLTDSRGQYRLSGTEIGKRKVLTIARGYKPASKTVSLAQPGAVRTLNIALVAATP